MPLPIFDVNEIELATPCHVKWEDMQGTDRTRFCGACQKNVFNISALGRNEALDLIRKADGPMCVRFYKRSDGTVLTSDCPVGLAMVARRAKRFALGAAATSLGAIASILALLVLPARKTCEMRPPETVVEKAIIKVAEVQKDLQVKKDELLVGERPYEAVAGGIRAMPMGTMSARTTPPTKVEVDGMPFGETPLAGASLEVGEHTVRFTNAALGVDVTRQITVKMGEDVKLALDLRVAHKK